MKTIITKLNLKPLNIIISLTLIWLAFFADLKLVEILKTKTSIGEDNATYITTALICLVAIISMICLVGSKNIGKLFKEPKYKFFKTVLISILFLIISGIVAIVGGKISQNIMHATTQANQALKNPKRMLIILPFHMIFEEAWTFIMLFIIANKLYLKNKNYSKSFWIASIISSVVFALAHVITYGDGNILLPIVQVLLVQGLVRVVYNFSAYKTNLILVSFLIHWIYDTTFTILNIIASSL